MGTICAGNEYVGQQLPRKASPILRNGAEDTFLHLSFDFPLIDWGRRYRGVQTARMQKAQAFHDLARKRTEYSNKWLEAEQKASLAQTELKAFPDPL